MADFFGLTGVYTVTETAMLVLTGVILALFAVTIAVSLYALALRGLHRRREQLWERLKEAWEEPILAAITDPEQIDALRAEVPDRYRLHFVQFVLDYSRRVRGSERKTLRRLVEPYLDEVAARTRHRNSEVRTRAIQTLGTLGLPRYEDEVLAGLEDPSPLVSMVAARYLSRHEFPQYAPAVMKHLDRFHGWNRWFLASMLASIGPEASPVLRQGISDTTAAPWLRAVHAEALRMQLDPLSGDLAVQALETTDDQDLGASLLRLLAAVGRSEHLPKLRELCSSPDVVIRAQALHALGQLSGEGEIPLLLEAMYDPSPWAALHAARGVKEAGGSALLREIAESDHPNASLAGQVLFEEEAA